MIGKEIDSWNIAGKRAPFRKLSYTFCTILSVDFFTFQFKNRQIENKSIHIRKMRTRWKMTGFSLLIFSNFKVSKNFCQSKTQQTIQMSSFPLRNPTFHDDQQQYSLNSSFQAHTTPSISLSPLFSMATNAGCVKVRKEEGVRNQQHWRPPTPPHQQKNNCRCMCPKKGKHIKCNPMLRPRAVSQTHKRTYTYAQVCRTPVTLAHKTGIDKFSL